MAVEMFRAAYTPDLNEAALSRFLAAPIDIRGRRAWNNKLASQGADHGTS